MNLLISAEAAEFDDSTEFPELPIKSIASCSQRN
jgi:hypothetical protein